MPVFSNLADGRGTYPLNVRIILQQQEQLEDSARVVFEDRFFGGFDITVPDLETVVDQFCFFFDIGVDDDFAEVLQQHLVQSFKFDDGTVVLLHELLDGFVVGVVAIFKAEFMCQVALIVEQQAVFPASGEVVQAAADTPQQVLALDQGLVFIFQQEVFLYQVMQAVGIKMAFGNPADHLDVAQAATALLEVWFEVVGGIVELAVALHLFFQFGLEE